MSGSPESKPPSEFSIRLAHIGVIVHRIDASLVLYRRLGLSEAGRVDFPQEGVRIAFIPVESPPPDAATPDDGLTPIGEADRIEEGARIELMETLEAAGPLHRFLASRGEGIHHLALEVPNLEVALARVRDAGGRPIDQTPRQGSEGTRVAFIHPASTCGVLIELIERPERSQHSVHLP